jgi:hypothetical protein
MRPPLSLRLCALGLVACGASSAGSQETEGPTGDSGANPSPGTSAQDGGAGDSGASGEMGAPDAAGEEGGEDAVEDAATTDGGGSPSPINLSMWMLQLPIGSGQSPTTISGSQLAAGFSDAYFYRATDGGLVFMDPATGITTSGSVHCRTEFHEADSSGQGANWTSSGTNTMTVSGTVLQVGGGSGGVVTIAQVFNGSDGITLAELQYSVKRSAFGLFYEEAKGGGDTTDLNTSISLNSTYTFTVDFSKGELTVIVNGTQVYSHKPSSAVSGNNFYFKVGNYDQTTSAGPVSTTPYTVVENYSIAVVHM